jgi:hypothetical protein
MDLPSRASRAALEGMLELLPPAAGPYTQDLCIAALAPLVAMDLGQPRERRLGDSSPSAEGLACSPSSSETAQLPTAPSLAVACRRRRPPRC